MIGLIHKFVNDLGIAAYQLMHGYAVIGKKGRSIYFECESKEEAETLSDLEYEYQPPNDFYIFDSCLMYLKKINDRDPKLIEGQDHKIVEDLGVAAYLLMLECDKSRKIETKVVGKRGGTVHFCCPKDKAREFDRRSYQYLPSQFHSYDSNLMAIKKIGEYMPSDDFRGK